jgi:glycine betaine/proline transport system substrate-binding protein
VEFWKTWVAVAEYVPADSQKVYESIRIGDVDISHEVWQSAFGKSFDAARDAGGLLDWGDHVARSLEDMGYPNWVVDKGLCPGLPNWEALKAENVGKISQHLTQVEKAVG